jgi:enoyl-CoA hydratase/carnithine racemase
MTDAPHMLVEEADGILVATLNRPEKLNALSRETLSILEQAVVRLRDAPELKVMLIRATGRYFSAGADLRENAVTAPPTTGTAIREMHRLELNGMRRIYDEMEAIEKPIVVAHQGTCVGGGLEMSLSCDFRLAAASARYSFPEGKMGVLPATNGISRLVRLVGAHWARYFVMANLQADAQKALIMGLVHEVFPDEGFDDSVMAFCRHLASNNPAQMGAAKVAIEIARELSPTQAASVERLANSALMLAPTYLEGFRAHIATIGDKKGG